MSYDGWRPVRFDDFVPRMKKSNLSILAWTLIYLMNLVLVFVFQGIIYDLPSKEVDDLAYRVRYEAAGPVESELFPGYQVLDAYSNFFLLRGSEGELELAVLKQGGSIRGYKIEDTLSVPEGQDVALNIETERNVYTLRIVDGSYIDEEGTLVEQNRNLGAVFWRSYISGNTLTVELLIAVVMLLVEYGIYCQIQKLRE